MGRSSKPVTILVTSKELFETKEVQALVAKGHDIYLSEIPADMVIGPNVWQSDLELVKYLPLAIRAARERKYGGKGVTHDVDGTLEKPEGSGEGGGMAEGAVGGLVDGDEAGC